METKRTGAIDPGQRRLRAGLHRVTAGRGDPPAARRARGVADESMCERCGNVYRDKRWLAGTRGEREWPIGFAWTICPACRQLASREFLGRVVVRGRKALDAEAAIRARVQNVAARARFTQPQRRLISIERRGEGFEILTSSQKLAHRIVAALVDAFGGRGTYAWSSEDGELEATWTWDADPRKKASGEPAVAAPPRRATARERADRLRAAALAVGKQVPDLEIQGRQVDIEPAWRDRVERRVEGWGKRFPELTRVHVTFAHGAHHRHGAEEVTVNATSAGRTLQATKRGGRMEIPLRETMAALERELEQVHEERRHVLKPPGARTIGSVKRIWRDAGYGFIRLDRGDEAYFHRDSLHGLPFRALAPGMPVEVELEEGDRGLQASRVFPVGQRDRT